MEGDDYRGVEARVVYRRSSVLASMELPGGRRGVCGSSARLNAAGSIRDQRGALMRR
jgi:hypothetical protein